MTQPPIQGSECACGHDLNSHPPHPAHLFAWPCRACDCRDYREENYWPNRELGYAQRMAPFMWVGGS